MTGPLKWHGGKHDLAKWIIGLMPPRCKNPNKPDPVDNGWLHYVEPYFGGGAVLLANDPEGISEVVNDLNGGLTNFWRMLQSVKHFDELNRILNTTPFSEAEFNGSDQDFKVCMGEPVLAAANFFIRCRQSLSGRMDSFAGITRNRTRRGMNEQGLPAVHARLVRVLIRNRPALEIISKEDGPRTLFYLDPPYLHETRVTTGEYEYEMSAQEHAELLNALQSINGRFLLSGYHSGMYDRAAAENGWRCHEMKITNHAASGKTKRIMTECVWSNF